jgi:Flagellar biosynthesis pathway, component FlhB
MSDSQERTETATDKRMKEVRRKGKLSKSQDLTTWLGLGAAALLLPATIVLGTNAGVSQIFAVGKTAEEPTDANALQALGSGMASIVPTIALLLVAVVVAILAGSVIQGGIHLRKLEGKFEQFNLANGFKHTFGGQALWNGSKALLKTGVVGLALYLVIQSLLPVLMGAGRQHAQRARRPDGRRHHRPAPDRDHRRVSSSRPSTSSSSCAATASRPG